MMMPHGHCYLWSPSLIHLMATTDIIIAISYFIIPITLGFAIFRTNGEIPPKFRFSLVSFALFIFFCGTGHLIDVINIWNPWYWAKGFWNIGTAVVSIATAITSIPIAIRFLIWMRLAEGKP